MKHLVYIFAIGINIITLCYGRELPSRHSRRDTAGLHIEVPNPELPKIPIPAVAKEEKPLVIETEGFLKDIETNKDKNTIEKVSDVENVKPLNNNSNVTAEPPVTNETEVVQQVARKLPGDLDVGALKRGSLVFLGLCVIILVYYAWKTYRLKRNSSSPVMVQKYGVRANRADIEMRPLPLDEEEDDDTLFEIGNGTTRQ